ncbi:hypothetical protein COBT_003930 [Conglomerata obtusa]
MEIEGIKEDTQRIISSLKYLGDAALEWYVGIDKKPKSWSSMRIRILEYWKEEKKIKEEKDRRIQMEIEIKKRVEEIVNSEMKQFRNTFYNEKKNVKNNFRGAFTKGRNFNEGKIENSIECFKCGQAGHLARGCL